MAAVRRFISKACPQSEPNTAAAFAPMGSVQNDATDFQDTLRLPSPQGE